jgi:hypothetical protein
MESSDHPLTPDSQHRHLNPPASNPSDRQDTARREHGNPGVAGKELPQPSNRGATNNIDEK